MNETPRVSIVIASIVGPPYVDDCLDSVESQAKDSGAEAIVVACGSPEYASRIAGKYPWVKVVHCAERESVSALRRRGVQAASGDIVAIIEERCLAAPNWLRRAVQAIGRHGGVVGGPVAPCAYTRLRDWVVYFCEYNHCMPPWQEGGVHALGTANIAYSRALMLEYAEQLEDGHWESCLHPRLWAEGIRFHAAAAMVVQKRGQFNYRYYLRQRYWFSRAYAGARGLPASHKVLYLLASPLLPLLLLARTAQRVIKKNCHVDKFILSLPLLMPVMIVYVAGEIVGYLAGPGDALLKVE
jgi:glycosyltransferase involved in cell wall biosynthesis